MSKKSATPEPKELARAIVDRYLVHMDLDTLVYPSPDDILAGKFEKLLDVVVEQATAKSPDYYRGLDRGDMPHNYAMIGSHAGFLVGLELGRRLGGAR